VNCVIVIEYRTDMDGAENRLWPIARYCLGTYLEWLKKATKLLVQYNRSVRRVSGIRGSSFGIVTRLRSGRYGV